MTQCVHVHEPIVCTCDVPYCQSGQCAKVVYSSQHCVWRQWCCYEELALEAGDMEKVSLWQLGGRGERGS